MIFTTHGVIGAAVRAGTAKACGVPDECCLWLGILGAVEGMAPDALDWLAWAIFGWERWVLYRKMHADWRWWGLLFWGWGAHVICDIPFHKNPGEDWWGRLGWLDLLGLFSGIVVLWLVFIR